MKNSYKWVFQGLKKLRRFFQTLFVVAGGFRKWLEQKRSEYGGELGGWAHSSTCRCHSAPALTGPHTLAVSDSKAIPEDAGPLAL